jgi:glycerol-3-phosphate acyltransferase PlsY
MMIAETALIAAAYSLGAIPFGAMIARRYGVDILKSGSGNIGATNVHRVIGKTAGLTVSFLDIFKGLGPSAAAWLLFGDAEYVQLLSFWAGMAAVVGHCFSPFLKFKGGKGTATGFGALLGSTPLVALGVLVVFVSVGAATRYVSMASVLAALSIMVFGLIAKEPTPLIWSYVALSLFVVFRHRANIRRLLAGTERKFSLKGGDKTAAVAAVEASAEADEGEPSSGQAAQVGER